MVGLAYAIIYGFVFLTGIVIGSFLNVLIYRIPIEINIARGRSFCPNCKNALLARDMVPLVSFALLRGHCRFCGKKISGRYPLVEFLGGVLAVMSVLFFWFSWQALLAFAVSCILLTVAFIDWDTQEIPNILSIIILGLGIVTTVLTLTGVFGGAGMTMTGFDNAGIISRLIGMVEISLPMLLMNLIIKDSFGGGDIKLCAACGFFLGWRSMLVGAFLGIIAGGIYGIYLLAGRKKGGKEHFAFGPFLSFGITVALFAGNTVWESYLAIFNF